MSFAKYRVGLGSHGYSQYYLIVEVRVRVILYSTKLDGSGKLIDGLINFLVPEEKIELSRTISNLALKLRQPRVEPIIAIVLATTPKELIDVLTIGELLQDIRLFLVLPDRKPDTVAKGHRLRPRFITYADNDIMESADVIKKIFENVTKQDRAVTRNETVLTDP